MKINEQAALAIVLAQYEKVLLDLNKGYVPSIGEVEHYLECLHQARESIPVEAMLLALGALAKVSNEI